MKRSAFAAAVTLAATLTFGVSGALAASLPGSQLTRWAARDGVSIPAPLADAITKKLGAASPAATLGATQAPTTQQQELQASDGVLTGWSVSLTADGHTALVGSPGNAVGAAYVFVEHGGKWSEAQELDSPVGSAEDSYGSSVAVSGDGSTVLVGAYSGGTTENGIVYSYSRQGSTYVLDGQITAPDGAPGDEFGYSVSLSALGNVALIGAPDHNTYQGAAYVFVHGPRSWSEQREFQDPGGSFDTYGASVSEAADGLAGVVGAPFTNEAQGAAYAISQLNGSQQALPAPASAAPVLYGISVSINALGIRALVGSPSAYLGDGAAFVFDNHGGNWTQSQQLVPSNPSGADLFGYSVALNYLGNGALVGATERNGTDGSAFTFFGYPTLTQQRELDDPVPGSGAEYGFSVAMDALGDQLLIGAPYQNGIQGAAWAVAN